MKPSKRIEEIYNSIICPNGEIAVINRHLAVCRYLDEQWVENLKDEIEDACKNGKGYKTAREMHEDIFREQSEKEEKCECDHCEKRKEGDPFVLGGDIIDYEGDFRPEAEEEIKKLFVSKQKVLQIIEEMKPVDSVYSPLTPTGEAIRDTLSSLSDKIKEL